MISLFKAFAEYPDLQIIEIQDNLLMKEHDYTAFADCLSRLQFIAVLNIGDSELKDLGAQAVLRALMQTSPHLIELYLEYNDLEQPATAALVKELLNTKPQLGRINLKGNEFDEETIQELKTAFLAADREDALDDFDSEDEDC
jgi:Ran GTPase-activating protein (RanGAP) involved in mRNA processing and transport